MLFWQAFSYCLDKGDKTKPPSGGKRLIISIPLHGAELYFREEEPSALYVA